MYINDNKFWICFCTVVFHLWFDAILYYTALHYDSRPLQVLCTAVLLWFFACLEVEHGTWLHDTIYVQVLYYRCSVRLLWLHGINLWPLHTFPGIGQWWCWFYCLCSSPKKGKEIQLPKLKILAILPHAILFQCSD